MNHVGHLCCGEMKLLFRFHFSDELFIMAGDKVIFGLPPMVVFKTIAAPSVTVKTGFGWFPKKN